MGVPQRSVLRPLFFNVFINDIFSLVENTEIYNYAGETTTYVYYYELGNFVSKLELAADELSKWLHDNDMKLNTEKCHRLIFREKSKNVSVQIGTAAIAESTKVKLLGVTLNKDIDFKNHKLTL